MCKTRQFEEINQLFKKIKKLPTPSSTYFNLVNYLKNPKTSVVGAAHIIEQDVSMTAELLKTVNSSAFSFSAKVSSPLQAIRFLGLETLCSMVLRIGLYQSFEGPLQEEMIMEAVNIDSLAVANIAKRIAKREGFGPARTEECFCAGMLCSIGGLVLLDCFPERFASVAARARDGADPVEAETLEFGFSHYQIGGHFLEKWGFSEFVAKAVAYAGNPNAAGETSCGVVTVVHVARVLSGPFPGYFLGAGPDHSSGRMALDMDHLTAIGKQDSLTDWMIEATRKT